MRGIAVSSWAVLVLCCTGVLAETGAKVEHFDASGGEADKYQIVYITNADTGKTTGGTAFVVLRKSGNQELAYGYYIVKGMAKTGLVREKRVKKAGDESDPNTAITVVEVSKSQYGAAKVIIQAWSKKEEEIDGPSVVFYNRVSQILKACGMKVPYRSAYRAPNPVQWIGDIPA